MSQWMSLQIYHKNLKKHIKKNCRRGFNYKFISNQIKWDFQSFEKYIIKTQIHLWWQSEKVSSGNILLRVFSLTTLNIDHGVSWLISWGSNQSPGSLKWVQITKKIFKASYLKTKSGNKYALVSHRYLKPSKVFYLFFFFLARLGTNSLVCKKKITFFSKLCRMNGKPLDLGIK